MTLTHDRERAVRERAEVARATERTVLVNDRADACVQDRGVRLGDDWAHTGAAAGERVEAQQHEGAHHLALDLCAGARGVRANQAALQLLALLAGDLHLREGAEAGRDAVVGPRVVRELFDHAAALADAGERVGIDLYAGIKTGYCHNVCDGEGCGSEDHCVAHASISAHAGVRGYP